MVEWHSSEVACEAAVGDTYDEVAWASLLCVPTVLHQSNTPFPGSRANETGRMEIQISYRVVYSCRE
jgi:hypothetical protein